MSAFHDVLRKTFDDCAPRYPNGISATELLDEMRAAGYDNPYVNVLDVADALKEWLGPRE